MSNSFSKRKLVINIIPLVDILMVLIFFFLVTMQFRNYKVMNIELPDIKTAGLNNYLDRILIEINADGQIFFNSTLSSLNELEEVLLIASEINNDSNVLIAADEKIELGMLTKIMDLCRSSNLSKIRLQSR